MKKLLLLTLNVVVATIVWAGDVIPQQTSVNARSFMQQRETMALPDTSADDYIGCEWIYITVFSAFLSGSQLDTGYNSKTSCRCTQSRDAS